MESLCVYCGSRAGDNPAYADAARSFGTLLAERGVTVVYGGGGVGMMGAVADAALDAGGEVVGVIPEALAAAEQAREGLTELLVVESMHERKRTMAERAEGFVALPGGFGTLEEIVEVLTWAQLGIHGKPCGLLNVAGYYDDLLAFFDHQHAEGFVDARHRGMVAVESDPEELLARFEAYRPPPVRAEVEPDES
jgi:uncharacterized protein (TIGR00730 family)